MGDHRAGSSGSTATTAPSESRVAGRRVARHAAEQRTSQPYVGRRVAGIAPSPVVPVQIEPVLVEPVLSEPVLAEPACETEHEPPAGTVAYAGRRVAGRNPVSPPMATPSPVAPAGRRIAVATELLAGVDGADDADDVSGHFQPSPATATPTGYVGRRVARPVGLISEPLVIEPVAPPRHASPPSPAPVLDVPALDAALLDALVLDAPVLDAPALDAPALDTSVLAAPVIELPVPFEVPVENAPVAEVEAAALVAPVLAVHPELRVEPHPLVRATPRHTRPGGRRASRRTRVPSLPLLAGVAVLAISAGGALQAVHPRLAGEADGRISPASALSGGNGVGSASLLGRGTTVSRDSDRTAGALQNAADAQAKARDVALSVFASQAQKRAAQIELHRWVLPVQPGVYHLTARFGEYSYLWSSMHTGLDFAAPTGTPIMAVAGGTITEVGYSGAYGNRTIETLPDGTELWYCHQNEFGTEVGATVKPGQVIGYIGSTGNVTGPHLHLEVHPDGGDPVDPYTALQAHGLNP